VKNRTVSSPITIAISVIVLGLAMVLVHACRVHYATRRAAVINSIGELLSAMERWQNDGILTNSGRGFRVYPYTNVVLVDGTPHQGRIAASGHWIEDAGFMVMTAEGSMLWMDRKRPPVVVRRPDGNVAMPERFQ
jgi:hypothetical protein